MISLFLVLLLFFIHLAAAQDGDTLKNEVDALVTEQLDKGKIPGAAVVLIQNGEVAWLQTYGYADVESQTPITGDTAFNVASIAKPLTVWGIMQMVQNGELDLDAPLNGYLTSWQIPGGRRDPNEATLRRVLSHTAGLTAEGYAGVDPGEELPSLLEVLSDGWGRSPKVSISTTPGLSFRYSGGGYTVLQLMIEDQTGLSYDDFMRQTVLDPLGMDHSLFATPENGAATPYDESLNPLPHRQFITKAAGGLYTTPNDLATFVIASMGADAGRGLLTSDSLNEMYTPAENSDSREGLYGFGHFITPLESGKRVVWHDAYNEGWRGIFAMLPEDGTGIVVLINGNNGTQVFRDITCAWAVWATGEEADAFC
jgi:CubicO group peptidase (beta-lactamase class C family)